jgi:glyoxylase-like metal-dependent hydrolase (beta-lactamase superfamily II)
MREVVPGIRRVTFALPLGIDHVHCYLLDGPDGWTIVDTGLGLPRIVDAWREHLAELERPVVRIVVTHMHPDHVGAAADVAELTGAPVYQGRVDHEQSVRAWGPDRPVARWAEHMREHGTPEPLVDEILADGARLWPLVHVPTDPEPLDEGDVLDGWHVLQLPGHADGHLSLLRDDGVLVAGDAILAGITPTVGLWPDSRPDPLGDYTASLNRLVDLEPRLALAGHEGPIDDPPARAREILVHHDERLELTVAALANGPSTAYDVSLRLFDGPLPPAQRRFALAETLSHLERLVILGAVERVDGCYDLVR